MKVKKNYKNACILVDGSSLLYRSYYGLKPLHTSQGEKIQAVYGFCRALYTIIQTFEPRWIVVAWDSKGETFRTQVFERYKATRQPPPHDVFIQKDHIKEFLEAIQVCQISMAGYEADDLIATLVKKCAGQTVVIVGPDKDLYQLIQGESVVIFDPFKKEIFDEEGFCEKYGFSPERLVLYHALVGDTSDNIPGVKGIGKKTATVLARSFASVQDLYDNLDEVASTRVRARLEEHKKEAFLSEKLFTLAHPSVEITKKDSVFVPKMWDAAGPFFRKFEFKSLLKTVNEQELSSDIGSKKTVSWTCHVVQTSDELEALMRALQKARLVAIDTETTGIRPLYDELVGISCAYTAQEAFYIPVAHKIDPESEHDTSQLDRDYVLEKMKSFLESSQHKKTFHNAKFDELIFSQYGIHVGGVIFDSLLAANLLKKEWQRINLKALSLEYLQEPMKSYKEVVGKRKTFAEMPIDKASTYAAFDALQTFKLKNVLEAELEKEPVLQDIFTSVEMPFHEVLFEVEKNGIMLDVEKLAQVEKKVKTALEKITHKIEAAINKKKAGELNLNSSQQIEQLLFDELKLPVIKKSSKGSRSTDHEVLLALSKVHPVPGMIIEYRELFKLLSTYLEPLAREVNEKTKRIHTSYSQTLVVTGRLSSSNPNLQNIPATKEFGLQIRSAFHAPRGSLFVSADYSQVELRILAHLSGDEALHDIFSKGLDVHVQTAAHLFGIPAQNVTYEQRQIGKRLNFSIMYGITPYGLSRELGISLVQAKKYRDSYLERFSGVAAWMEDVVAKAQEKGYVETWMGRRRYVSGLQERNRTLFEAARRIAINSPVQGTQAELMKKAMINLSHICKKKKINAKMILQIHDELIFEIKKDDVQQAETIITKTMESVVSWQIKLLVSLRSGKDWAEITK